MNIRLPKKSRYAKYADIRLICESFRKTFYKRSNFSQII